MLRSLITPIVNRFPALKYANFRLFLAGQGLSLIGTWMQRAAQQWLVYELTQSPFLLGLVGVFQFSPMLLLSLFAGVFVDRFPKKRLIIITQAVQMTQALILAALVFTHTIEYWHILVMAFTLGLSHTFDMPTRQSFFIELVGKDDLKSAIGLNSSIVNVGRITGPAIGGLVLMWLGTGYCFLINGLSFIPVIISLFMIKSYNGTIRKKGENLFREVGEGLKYVYANKAIFNAVVLMFIVGTIAMNNDVIVPVLAKDVLHQDARGYSFLLSLLGVGSLVGSLVFAGRKGDLLGRHTLFKSALCLGTMLIVAGLSQVYWLTMACLFVIGFFNMIVLGMVNSTIQLNASNEFRGRAMGVYSLVFIGTTPFGNLLAGTITEHWGPNVGFLACGALTVVLMVGYAGLKRK